MPVVVNDVNVSRLSQIKDFNFFRKLCDATCRQLENLTTHVRIKNEINTWINMELCLRFELRKSERDTEG